MPKSVKDTAELSYMPRGFSVAESSMQMITAEREAITAEGEAATKAAADNAAIKKANGIAIEQLINIASLEMSKWNKTAIDANKLETIEQVLSKKKYLNELLEQTLPQLPDSTDLSKKEFFSESDFFKFSESKREIERNIKNLSKLEDALREKKREGKGKGLTKKRKSTRRRRSRRHRKSTRRRRRKH